MLPKSLRKHLASILDSKIAGINAVGGGSINQAAKIDTVEGETYFLKWNRSAPDDMFPKEKKGLELLASAQAGLRVPQVEEVGEVEEAGYILIEFIAEKQGSRSSAEQFGTQLADLHRTTADYFGLEYDNYIGRLEQPNEPNKDWIDFFVEQRLQAQLKRAADEGKLSGKVRNNFDRLFKKLPGILPKEPPSLLHGDLWGGNYFFDEEGRAAVFDPAVYYGNREIEIAFTHLFGGFSTGFYEAYQQNYPLEPNFSRRKDIYNLYPLLVHTNMFGGHYARQVKSIVKRFA